MEAPVAKDTSVSKGSKAKLVIGGVVVALLLAGIGIGVGVGVKRHNDDKHKKNAKSTATAPASSPVVTAPSSNATGNGTSGNATLATTPKYKPVPAAQPGQNQTQILNSIGTNTSALTVQAYQDAQVLTVELVNEFVDFFLELAASAGLDNSTLKLLKDNRYLLVRYLRARRIDTVVKVMKDLAEAPDNPPDALVERIVKETVSVFDDGDFEKWLAAGAKDSTKLTPAQVKALNDLESELSTTIDTPEAYPDDPVQQLSYYESRLSDYGITLGQDPPNVGRRRLSAPARRHRMFDFEFGTGGDWPLRLAEAAGRLDRAQASGGRRMKAADPASVKRNLGLATFARSKVGIVFHAMQFVDSKDYLWPIVAYQDGPALAKKMVDQVNALYEISGVNLQFYIKEYRYDVDKYDYLLMGDRTTWQKCAADGEACTCKLAAQHNLQPTKYINIYIAGSFAYPGLKQLTVGYTSTLPFIQDMCSNVEGWKQAAAAKTQHLWLIYDSFDIASTVLDNRYNEGAATLAHELGHFLGLLHTHEGDCVSGDYVPDTPSNLVVQDQPWANDLYKWCATFLAGKKPATAVLKAFDSCASDKFIDNVFNIMSYTPAPCNLFFTVGQVRRLQTITSRVYPTMLTKV